MSQTQAQVLDNSNIPSRSPAATNIKSRDGVQTALPAQLVKEFSLLPKLTREQCGHLRHFHNLASQPDGDWSFMGGASGQDNDEGSYRYQLAFMAYAAGAAHYHRLPALRSVFRSLLEKLIKKMLHPDVWGYWYLTSQSGVKLDPDLKELRKPWADPVCKENVMVSNKRTSLDFFAWIQHRCHVQYEPRLPRNFLIHVVLVFRSSVSNGISLLDALRRRSLRRKGQHCLRLESPVLGYGSRAIQLQ